MARGSSLPTVHVDRRVSAEDLAFAAGRAILVGPEDDDLRTADAALIGVGRVWDAARFARFPNLEVVCRMGVGHDNVDLAAAGRAGVIVGNTPDAPTVSTAEHTLALMLAVTKELGVHRAGSPRGPMARRLAPVARGGAAVVERFAPDPLARRITRVVTGQRGSGAATALELESTTLGLVGFGRIGRRVAQGAQALGMRVLATSATRTSGTDAGVTLVELDELLAESHVVSLHAPADESTRRLISADAIRTMRAGAYLVNCARGALVDHDALAAAVTGGHLAGAGLDVTDPDPLPLGHPLLGLPNVIITPHLASTTRAGRRRLFEHAFDNAVAALDGDPRWVVMPAATP